MIFSKKSKLNPYDNQNNGQMIPKTNPAMKRIKIRKILSPANIPFNGDIIEYQQIVKIRNKIN